MSAAKWVDLSRFGARLEIVQNPTLRSKRLRLVIEDSERFQNTFTGKPWEEHDAATRNTLRAAIELAGFVIDVDETTERHVAAGGSREDRAQPRRAVALYCEDLTITYAKLLGMVPGLKTTDFVSAEQVQPQGQPYQWISDEAFRNATKDVDGLHLQLDAGKGMLVPCKAGTVPTFFVPRQNPPRIEWNYMTAHDAGVVLDKAAWLAFAGAERGMLEVWTTPESCAQAHGLADASEQHVRRLALPYAVPVGFKPEAQSVVVAPDARFHRAELPWATRGWLQHAAMERNALERLADVMADAPSAADSADREILLEASRTCVAEADRILEQFMPAPLKPAWQNFLAARGDGSIFSNGAERASALHQVYEPVLLASDRAWVNFALQRLAVIEHNGYALEHGEPLITVRMTSATEHDRAQKYQDRQHQLRQFVCESLVIGLEAPSAKEFVYERVIATDPARDQFMGEFRQPKVSMDQPAGWQAFTQQLGERVAAEPRGAWAVLQSAPQEIAGRTHRSWTALFSTGGSGKAMQLFLGGETAPRSFRDVLEQAIQAEADRMRRDVRVESAKEKNVSAVRALLDAGLQVTQTFKNLQLRQYPDPINAVVTSIQPDAGTLTLELMRGYGRARVKEQPVVGGEDFAVGIGASDAAKPVWKLTAEAYLRDRIRVRQDLWAQQHYLSDWRVAFEYQNPSPVGPTRGVRFVRSADDAHVGQAINALFGAAVVASVVPARSATLKDAELVELGAAHHKRLVADAVAAGEPVPHDVRAEYLDIAAPASQPAGDTAAETTDESPDTQSDVAVEPRGGRASRRRQAEVEAEAVHEDVGEKIGGARKDFYANRMTVADLSSMNDLEKVSVVSKRNVWPALDYAAMRSDGVEPLVAYAVKWIKDKINVNPAQAEHAHTFIHAVGSIRDHFEGAKTAEDFIKACLRLQNQLIPRNPDTGNILSYDRYGKLSQAIGKDAMRLLQDPKVVLYRAAYRTQNNTSWDRLIKAAPTRTADAGADAEGTTPDAGKQYRPQRPHLDHLERVGTDWRQDRDVTGEELLEHFGFRGIEYGNWLPQDERQLVLNHAYDAFMDLADVIGLPPKALSLDGQLAIAFGARGKSGASAHYEPALNVVNMTRINGAGALAHEWGHALDRWLSVKTSSRSIFLSDEDDVRKLPHAAPAFVQTAHQAMSRLSEIPLAIDKAIERQEAIVLTAVAKARRNLTGFATGDYYTGFEQDGPKASERRSYVNSVQGQVEAAFELLNPKAIAENANAAASAFLKTALPAKITELYQLHGGEKRGFLGKTSDHIEAWFGSGVRGLRQLAYLRDAKNHHAEFEPVGCPLPDGTYEALRNSPTGFLSAAKALDTKRAKPYYAKPRELFARAFEAFVFDELADRGSKSDYLVHGVTAECYGNDYAGNPYPMGDERPRFNEALRGAMVELSNHFAVAAEADKDDAPMVASM